MDVPLLLVELQLFDLLLEGTVLLLDRVSDDLGHHFLVAFELLRVWHHKS